MRDVEHLLRSTAEAEGRHFWFRGFRAFVTPLLKRAVAEHPHARILDCGCGTGANIEMLGRFGLAFGVDLSEVGLRISHDAGRTRLTRATMAALPFPANTFDLVTSFDVLYALDARDERAAVSEMYRLTRPGGYALINVPALNMMRGNHSVLSHEVRRYSRRDLRRLMLDAGFTIARLTYTNLTLFLPLATLRLAQRWRGLADEANATREISVPPAPINMLLTGLLLVESLWLRLIDNPCGSSLMCLARKPAGSSAAAPGLR